MANTKLEQVEELVKELSPEDQNLLIKHLTQRRRNIPENGESQSRDDEIEKILNAAWGILGTGKTPDELDRELNEMRDWDWSRNWH